MKLVIDNLTSITGWTIASPSTIEAITESKYIAGLNDSSLMIKFDEDDTTRIATKTFGTAFDVSSYESLVFNIWSQQKGKNKYYNKPSDFSYKIDIDGVREFYIPIYKTFSDIVIGIEDVTSITQIKITPLHDDTDYITISEMIAEKEDIPYDILAAVKESIDYYTAQQDDILIGTVNASAGDTSISMTNPSYLDRYGVIKIDDGVNSEIHQMDDNNSSTFELNDNFDGDSILNNYTSANVYLQFPSYINPGQYEIRLPGISIWGISPEPVLRGGKLDKLNDSFLVSGGSKERVEGQILNYTIQIDCESRSQELIDIMTKSVRKLISQESLWINGRRHDVYYTGSPIELKVNEGIDYIPKVQYSFDVEVKENINDRVALPATTTVNVTATIL